MSGNRNLPPYTTYPADQLQDLLAAQTPGGSSTQDSLQQAFGALYQPFNPQLITQFAAPREEEIELEQLTQPQRLVPGSRGGTVSTAGKGEQSQLGDGPQDQHVDGAVPVERGNQVLVRTDAPYGLSTVRVARQNTGGDELLKRLADR